jgi:hypothetical protein
VSAEVVDELTWTCGECGAVIALGHEDDNVMPALRTALRERLVREHRCATR